MLRSRALVTVALATLALSSLPACGASLLVTPPSYALTASANSAAAAQAQAPVAMSANAVSPVGGPVAVVQAQSSAHGAIAPEHDVRAGVAVNVRVQFFGVPLDGAQDVVFVLDRSGSMSGITAGTNAQQLGMSPVAGALVGLGASLAASATRAPVPTKMEAAKAELLRTLDAMPDGTRFNVVFFDNDVSALSPAMVQLHPGTRQQAHAFISGIRPGGSTAAVPALRAAYAMGARRVVLLSDGLPNTGGGANELLSEARAQFSRGLRMDTVGLGVDQDSALLVTLANDSRGAHVAR